MTGATARPTRAASVLSAAPPEAFGFLSNQSAALRVDGSDLTVSSGGIALIGGEVIVAGRVCDGRARLATAAQSVSRAQVSLARA